MNDTIKDKAAFINWYIYNHRPTNEEAVWSLSNIKRKEIIERTYFTHNIKDKKVAMSVVSYDYEYNDGPDFVCYINGEVVQYRDFIAHILTNKHEDVYIELKYFRHKRCSVLKDMISDVKNVVMDLMIDMFTDSLLAKERLLKIEDEINKSLDSGDKELFMKLTSEKKELLDKAANLL